MSETVSADPDVVDVRRVLGGQVDAFEGIVRRWQGALVTLAYRYCRNRGQAEEMAQEAFLRAYRFLDRWQESAPFRSWLFTVATNLYRTETKRRRPPEVPLEFTGTLAGASDPRAALIADDVNETVRTAVARLPPKYRDAVVLYYFHEMDIEEASRTLAIPAGTLKARLHRGRALLERKLSGMLKSPTRAEAT